MPDMIIVAISFILKDVGNSWIYSGNSFCINKGVNPSGNFSLIKRPSK